VKSITISILSAIEKREGRKGGGKKKIRLVLNEKRGERKKWGRFGKKKKGKGERPSLDGCCAGKKEENPAIVLAGPKEEKERGGRFKKKGKGRKECRLFFREKKEGEFPAHEQKKKKILKKKKKKKKGGRGKKGKKITL